MRDRRVLVVVPSMVLLAITAVVWPLWPPPPIEPRLSPLGLVVAGLLAAVLAIVAGSLLVRFSASFRAASKRLERTVRSLGLSPASSSGLALLTGVSEELFFRGWLLHAIGPWGQAAVFMLMHPAGRAGWAYTAFTGVAGLAFGLLTLLTGSLVPAIVAHVGVNLHGFLSAPGTTFRGRRSRW
jgi:uncharacterized protein